MTTGTQGTTADDLDRLDDDAFRLTVRRWIEANYPREWRFPPYRLNWKATELWHRRLYEKGWAAPGWPKAYGGMGLPAHRQVIFMEELTRFGVGRAPDTGIAMLGPLLIRFGSPEQKARFLPKTLSCEIYWGQGYSEPNAGSDLANLRTQAVRDGDHYVINGSKIWTSYAHVADWFFMLVRTAKGRKKQEGISFILIDAKSPGITVRPIINLAMEHDFNQVFFDNVRVPVENLVGNEGDGWAIAKALLGHERIMVGSPTMVLGPLARLEALAADRGLFDDAAFRDRYTRIRLDVVDLSATFSRFVDVVRRGGEPGPEASILKLLATEIFQQITDLMLEVAGSDASVDQAMEPGGLRMHVPTMYFVSRPATIYGGSSEVQRNVIAKAVLNLPS
ncbi:MAG: acyl-CoA dehydrogenase family protein [Alphaproteobacteria bacterium]